MLPNNAFAMQADQDTICGDKSNPRARVRKASAGHTERAHLTSLQPPRNTVEMECVVALAPVFEEGNRESDSTASCNGTHYLD